MGEDIVKVKMRNNRLEIVVSDWADYEQVKEQLFIKLDKMAQFLTKGQSKVLFAGKDFTEGQKKEITGIVKTDYNVGDVNFCSLEQLEQIHKRQQMMDIENGDGKEVLKADNLTIEHIMPQTLTMEWSKNISEEEHEQYLHVLGNLSVTGYNSELSNKSFTEKKQIIKEYSKAVVLNSDVWDKDSWTIDDIKNRGKRLSSVVMQRYSIERINDDSIEFEYLKKVLLSDDLKSVTKKRLVSFYFDGSIYRQNIYASMLYDVIRLCDEKKPGLLEELAKSDWSFNDSYKHAHISYDDSKMRWPWEVKDGIYMEANISAHSIMRFIKALIRSYEFDENIFYASIVDEDNESLSEEDADNTASEE